ncbi:hypothetical protein ScPMuIL_001969 [Solemya velum]
MDITGKVAIVTGGAQGLGKAFVEVLLDNGAKVCFTDIRGEEGRGVADELGKIYSPNNILFVECDVTSHSGMEGLFSTVKEKFGPINILCNNAGIGGEAFPLWEKVVDINVKGTIRGTLLGLNNMRTDCGGVGGTIINIASLAGINPNPFGPVYAATKAAIIQLTRSWAANPAVLKAGVRLNVICPSFADTTMVRDISEEMVYNSTAAQDFIEKIGIMTTGDVAQAFLRLVKDETKNGSILSVTKQQGQNFIEVRPHPVD